MTPPPTVTELARKPCPTLSVAETAAELGVDPKTLYNLIAEGRCPFPVLTLGRRKRVSRYVLDSYLRGEL